MRGDRNERLTILSEAEKNALYGLPVFDDFQRIEFFAMTDAERCLALQRRGLLKQVYCLLQIGYFKAKHDLRFAPTQAWSDLSLLIAMLGR